MYSIMDTKTGIYNPPFFNHSHGEAERNFKQLVNDGKSTVHLHPTDFDLYYVGDYDDNSGKLMPKPAPEHIIKAVDLLSKQEQ